MQRPDDTIGPYTLVRSLGQGTFGQVWLAERRASLLTTLVALKFPHTEASDLEAIRREAELWRRASGHPNVVPVLEAEVYDGRVVIVSEYVAGGSLDVLLNQSERKIIETGTAVELARGILAGLDYLHRNELVHRDLKPSNVMLQDSIPRLTDFGLTRVLQSAANVTQIAGSPAYMAPEAFQGHYSPSSDIWACGVLLYEMLTGTLPYPQKELYALLMAILSGVEIQPLPESVPKHVRTAVMRALSKSPEDRFASAAEMRVALEAAVRADAMLSPQAPPDPVMATTTTADRLGPAEVEVGHALFMDIVGSSLLDMEDQARSVEKLTAAVREIREFQDATSRNQVICGPYGDGIFLVFFGSPEIPVRCAINLTRRLQRHPELRLRMGAHTGPVYRVQNIVEMQDVAGAGIYVAARVMDCGDAGHILLSGSIADLLSQIGTWRPRLHDLGECEVKHGLRLHLFNLQFDDVGNPSLPSKLTSEAQHPNPGISTNTRTDNAAPMDPAGQSTAAKRLVLLYKRHAQQDEYLVKVLENRLSASGHTVVVDRHLIIGVEWFEAMKREIRSADAVIVLLSSDSIASEMISLEVEMADEARQESGGPPQVLPVRMRYEGPLPEPLAHILDPLEYKLWEGPHHDSRLASELEWAISNPGGAVTRSGRKVTSHEPVMDMEPVGGPVPMGSKFYVERDTDSLFLNAVARRESVVLVKGPRQIGKTSLLARGLQQAREAGARVVITDFQKLNRDDLRSLESFYLALARLMARQMKLQVSLAVLEKGNAPNINFEDFLIDQIFGHVTVPLVWGLDEVDRLFDCPFGTEVFALFRSWHNDRQIDPHGPWSNLSQVICYATEAHLFINDPNQSPFNVGLHIQLHDFTEEQIADLNGRYGRPLKISSEIQAFHRLLGGHPYLVRRGLYALSSRNVGFSVFEAEAKREDGPFDDHLHRIVVLLDRDPELTDAVKEMVQGRPCPSRTAFFRLRTAGVITGDSASSATLRCALYGNYLLRHMIG